MLEVDVSSRVFSAADGSQLKVLDKLHFKLTPGSFTCIVGPSGCGKTTTLRMILGLDKGFEGQIQRLGSGPVAVAFQEPRLLPWRTVEQNIRLALPASREAMNLDALLDELGLLALRDFYPSELSLGLARRASLARAFALEPELLILDEPFVSLDDSNARRMRALLLSLWTSRPTTALMVTHDITEAIQLSDRILVFSERPATLLDDVVLEVPRSERDAEFCASILKRISAHSDG